MTTKTKEKRVEKINYKWGDWLVPTKEATKSGVLKVTDRGFCLGVHRNRVDLIVVKKGHKTSYIYSPHFWKNPNPQ